MFLSYQGFCLKIQVRRALPVSGHLITGHLVNWSLVTKWLCYLVIG